MLQHHDSDGEGCCWRDNTDKRLCHTYSSQSHYTWQPTTSPVQTGISTLGGKGGKSSKIWTESPFCLISMQEKVQHTTRQKNANTTTGSVSFFHYSRSFNVSLGGCNTQECIKYGDDKSLFIFTLLLSSNLENTILQVYEAVVLVRVRSYGKIAARCKTCWPWCFFSVCQSPGYHSHENS